MAEEKLKATGRLTWTGEVPVSGTLTRTLDSADGGKASEELPFVGKIAASSDLPLAGDLTLQLGGDGKPADPFRGFLQANAGIAAASVALTAPVFIGLPNVRDEALLEAMRNFLEPMAWVIIVSVGVAIVLQAGRAAARLWPRTLGGRGAFFVAFALTLVPAGFGVWALGIALALASDDAIRVPEAPPVVISLDQVEPGERVLPPQGEPAEEAGGGN